MLVLNLSKSDWNEILIGKSSWYMGMGGENRYVIFFKSWTSEPDEYLKGRVFVFDRHSQETRDLLGRDYILNFLRVTWDYPGTEFAVSDGNELMLYDFARGTLDTLYIADSSEIITGFSLSFDQKLTAVNIKKTSSGRTKQILRILRRGDGVATDLRVERDTTYGEQLRAEVNWGVEGIFYRSIYGDLISINPKSGEKEIIDTNVENMFLVERRKLFYVKHVDGRTSLYRHDMDTRERLDIMSGERLRFDFVGSAHGKAGSFYVAVNDNILIYNEKGNVQMIDFPKRGVTKYVQKDLIIQQANGDLLLFEQR